MIQGIHVTSPNLQKFGSFWEHWIAARPLGVFVEYNFKKDPVKLHEF